MTTRSIPWPRILAEGVAIVVVGLFGSSCGASTGPEFDPLTIVTTSLPDGSPTSNYSAALEATGGDGSYSWSVTSGALPRGLALSAGGDLSGRPTGPTQTFTVAVGSGDGQTAAQELSLVVEGALRPDELCSGAPGTHLASFEDSVLEGRVRDALGIDLQEDLTCALLRSLTDSLNARNEDRDASIVSLPGIQNLVNLRHLDLTYNQALSDLGPLSTLTALRSFTLHQGRITDLGPLSSLTGLQGLFMEANAVTDVGPLSALTNLEQLNLSDNSITDISGLGTLTNLEVLDLTRNSITDINALGGLTALTSLDLAGNALDNSAVPHLGALVSLNHLSLGENTISDISGLSGLANLYTLRLGGVALDDLSVLAGFTNLFTLSLADGAISNVSAIAGLTWLPRLELRRNALTDISALATLTALEFLDVSQNELVDLTGVAGLTKLWGFSSMSNRLTDISALGGLPNLQSVFLFNNADLRSISPLISNPGMGPGDAVDVRYTRVACADANALRAKGVSVLADNCPP